MSLLGILLLLAGAGLEATGLGLVALENVDVRRAFKRRDVRVYPPPTTVRLSSLGASAVISGGRTPTIEERLDAVAARIDGIETKLSDLAREIPEQVRRELEPVIASVENELRFELDELRRLIGLSVQPTRRRWLGLAAFALGLTLQTLANIVG